MASSTPSTAQLADVPVEDWPLERFDPSAAEVAVSTSVALLGLFLTAFIARIGRSSEASPE